MDALKWSWRSRNLEDAQAFSALAPTFLSCVGQDGEAEPGHRLTLKTAVWTLNPSSKCFHALRLIPGLRYFILFPIDLVSPSDDSNSLTGAWGICKISSICASAALERMYVCDHVYQRAHVNLPRVCCHHSDLCWCSGVLRATRFRFSLCYLHYCLFNGTFGICCYSKEVCRRWFVWIPRFVGAIISYDNELFVVLQMDLGSLYLPSLVYSSSIISLIFPPESWCKQNSMVLFVFPLVPQTIKNRIPSCTFYTHVWLGQLALLACYLHGLQIFVRLWMQWHKMMQFCSQTATEHQLKLIWRTSVGATACLTVIRRSQQILGGWRNDWLDVSVRFIKPLVQTWAPDSGRLEEIWRVPPHAETADRKWSVLKTAVKIYDVEFVQRQELRAPPGRLYSSPAESMWSSS